MSELFTGLRAGGAACPSDLVLDRLAAGELPGDQARSTRAHVETCEHCTARMKETSFDAFPEVDAGALLERIRRGAAAKERPQDAGDGLPTPITAHRRSRFLRGPAVATLALAACLALLFVTRKADDGTGGPGGAGETGSPEVIRLKGGRVLHVYRMTDTGSEEILSGTRLAPGARIRFVVDLPSEGRVLIVGREQSGALYTAWPLGPADAAQMQRPAGPGQALPGAVALDDKPGKETLFLVHCPTATGSPEARIQPLCTPRGPDAAPACPPECALSPFVLDKAK